MMQQAKGQAGGAFRVADYAAGALPTVCMAHRGFSGRYPENTLLAFEKAIEVGADAIEFDVRLSGDGHLVISHDKTLVKAFEGGHGKEVAEQPLAEIRQVDLGMGQHMPTLEEVVEQCGGRIGMNIQIKVRGEIFDRAIARCRDAGILDQVFFAVDWMDEFARLQAAYPDAWLCSLFHRTEHDDLVEPNVQAGARLVQPIIEVFIQGGRRLAEEARAAGLTLGVFHADTYAYLRWMQRVGVAGILTNFPDRMLEFFSRGEETTGPGSGRV